MNVLAWEIRNNMLNVYTKLKLKFYLKSILK